MEPADPRGAQARALARLQDPEGVALRELARLVVDEATATPLKDLATPRWIASQIATALEAVSQGDVARRWVDRQIAAGREAWTTEERPLRTWFPKEADEPLREMLGRPYSPDQELVFRIIDQPAMRGLVKEVLEDTLVRFQRRLRSLDKAGIGQLGARAAKRGRGLLGGMAQNLGGMAQNLGGLAENLAGVVAEELESVLHDRIRDFVQSATGEALKSISRYIADPSHAKSFGELRVAVLDVVLDTTVKDVAEEADKLKPEELVDVVVGAVRSMVADPGFVDETEKRVAKVLEQAGDGTLGAWLDEVGLKQVWADTTTELVAARLQAVVKTDRFAAWWAGLFAE